MIENIFPVWMPESVQALAAVCVTFFVAYQIVRFFAKRQERRDFFRREVLRFQVANK